MSHSGQFPQGENLCKAVRWLSDVGRHDFPALEEAARRFDLTPLEEDFLLQHFAHIKQRDESASGNP